MKPTNNLNTPIPMNKKLNTSLVLHQTKGMLIRQIEVNRNKQYSICIITDNNMCQPSIG
ncbi:hypothetical protein Fmac_015800 [Flemingia macrophylla]|uniref:Uncharacterized protein n=1 Tax=Flemingia macrophylla TaxID=520843 RepID=A0ABD1MFL0_9FABA